VMESLIVDVVPYRWSENYNQVNFVAESK